MTTPDPITLIPGMPAELANRILSRRERIPAGMTMSVTPPEPAQDGSQLPQNAPEQPDGVSDVEWQALGDPGKTALVRERVRATNAELTDPLMGVAEDDDPSSPTFIGRFVHELRIDSDAVITQEAADNMAALHLGGNRRPTETITGSAPPRPDLDYLQPVHVASRRHGVAGVAEVVGWSWDLAGRWNFTLAARSLL
jgi:hypothetical protein